MKEITLTRNQIFKMNKIVDHFKDVHRFTITEDTSSGIGPAVSVKCNLIDAGTEMKADITEYDKW